MNLNRPETLIDQIATIVQSGYSSQKTSTQVAEEIGILLRHRLVEATN